MPVKITVRPNGPNVVEGEVEVYDASGKKLDTGGRPTIALCRCGGSSNKPFCDGTHNKIAFKAS
ncbi:MAG TPA: CDGSH iron-sulfur domain-containing protein [Methylomirabilota bacterium]|jgi:3-phenylpropionate/trans-cinnamate dioxygenase ferredoxin subunit|nr:CDGSH iron-sulfur domain-containing protein [Methylomirabilota bacterium]